MLTFIGKILVFLNAILATALLAWSVSLFTNRVEWPAADYRGRYDKADEFRDKKLTALPAEYGKAIAAGNLLYADARVAVSDAEALLAGRSRLLAGKLAQARQDKGGKFFELERAGAKPGAPLGDRLDLNSAVATDILRKDGTKVPLLGLAELEGKLADAVTATGLAVKEKVGYDADAAKLDIEVKRLNVSIDRYRVAIAQWEDERRYLDDNRVNWDAQLITLRKRNEQLQEGLKKFGVTVPTAAAARR